jgi:hypothetical protein
MGGIYEVRCKDGLMCHDIHTKFLKHWFIHSKVDSVTQAKRCTDTQTARISHKLLLFIF